MVYSWKCYGYAVDANVVGKEFEAIEKRYGAITSENVLASAKSEDSPIHDVFEWDDSVAAHQYRLTQASKLICNLAIEPDRVEKPVKVRAYMEVSDNARGTFINTETAFKNPDTRNIVLERALRELKAYRDKYQNLTELAGLFGVIDEVLAKEGEE